MVHMKSTIAVLVFATLASTMARAKTPVKAPAQAGATVEKVLDFYHTEDFLDDCLKHVEDALERRKKELAVDDAAAKRLKDVAARIYVKRNLYDVFKVAYAKQTTLENMTALWEWMNSPIGLLLRKAYSDHYKTPYKSWKAYYDKESTNVLKPNRKNALNTLLVSSGQNELAITKILGADFAVWWALNAIQPQPETLRYIRSKITPRRTRYIEPARAYYEIFDAALLRDLKNEQIDELTRFSTSVIGQGADKAYRAALEMTLDSAAKTLGSQLAKGTK